MGYIGGSAGFGEEGWEECSAYVGGVAVEMGAGGLWVRGEGKTERREGTNPTSIRMNVSAKRTLLPSVPP